MKFMGLREIVDRLFERAAPKPSVPIVPSVKPTACPYPLTSDDGTMADCQSKKHCMCKEPR